MQYNPYHTTVTSQTNGTFGEVVPSGNTALGIIGMIIGALLGGVLWVLVAQLGYIVGFVGFIMVYASLKGYELLGKKKVDKVSVIIALIISLVVIFISQYITYTIELYKLYEHYYTFSECLTHLRYYLSNISELMSSFIRDLIIGYVFTIVASFTFLRNGLKRQR